MTEYLQGLSLLEIMNQKSNNFSESKISKILKQIFFLLDDLHSKGIMHRDLKPENLIFQTLKMKTIKLIDFGLAEYYANEQFLFPRCGTPGFVAPEIITNKEMKSNYNCACDLFSAGCILHFLLFKQFLFCNNVLSQLIIENKQCEIDFNDQKYQKISPAAKQLLQGLLEKNPEKRWTAKQALESEFIKGDQKQIEINIKSLQQLEIVQQSQDISTSGKFLQEASPLNQKNQINENLIIQKNLVGCEKKLDSSKKLNQQSKNDSDNSISRHQEINYQTEFEPIQQNNVISQNFQGLVSPKEIERKKPKLKKSIFKYGTVNMQIGAKNEEESKVEQLANLKLN